MDESTPPTSKPNEFVIPPDRRCVITDIAIFEATECLMTKSEPVNLDDIGPDDRVCAIYQEEFHVSKKHFHALVKTVCGHIFGKQCIVIWLDPLCIWDLIERPLMRMLY